MLPVITVKLPFITQFHPHHLLHHQVLSLGFPPKATGISLVQTKISFKTREDLDQIFHYPPPDS